MKASSANPIPKSEPKPQRTLLVVLFFLCAVGFLVYRVLGTLAHSGTTPQLRVEENLSIVAPPAPLKEDPSALRDRLRAIVAKSNNLLDSSTVVPKEWLTFAREAGLAGDELTAYYALQVASTDARGRFNPTLFEARGHSEMQLCLFDSAMQTYTGGEGQFNAQLGLSRAQAGLQHNDQAMEILHSLAKSIAPNDFASHMEIATALEEHGQQAEAVEQLRQAHAIAPENSTITRRLAFALHNRQQFAEAQTLLESLLGKEKEAEAARTHLLLGKLLQNPLNPKKDPALAESHLLLALREESQKAEALRALGEMLLEQNRVRPAVALYAQLLALNPNDASARLQLANAYLRLGDTVNGEAQRQIAQPLIEQRSREEGLVTLRNQKPTEPQPHIELGKCYQEQGKLSQAFAEFQVAYALSKGTGEAEKSLKSLYQRLELPFPRFQELKLVSLEPLMQGGMKHRWE